MSDDTPLIPNRSMVAISKDFFKRNTDVNGIVMGVAHADPVRTYIVKPMDHALLTELKYDCTVIPETSLRVIREGKPRSEMVRPHMPRGANVRGPQMPPHMRGNPPPLMPPHMQPLTPPRMPPQLKNKLASKNKQPKN